MSKSLVVKSISKTILIIVMSLTMVSCKSNPSSTPAPIVQPVFQSETLVQDIRQVQEIAVVQKVTLLLPLHGSLAGNGDAIRNGFIAANYYAVQNGHEALDIKIVDTSQGEITSLYRKAVADGAEFIVGPLTKNDVEAIANMGSLQVPTLALNTVDNYREVNANNLYQFGLSAQDEAVQIAKQARIAHYGRALIVAPSSAWGKSLANVAQNTWQNAGGSVVASILYDDGTNLTEQVQSALNIDGSQQNAKMLYQTLQEKFKFVPRRRHDLDVVLLIAQPKDARQIRPLLEFFFAGDLPVYAISSIYSGFPQPSIDKDLDGIIFCDIPWVLRSPDQLAPNLAALHNAIITDWPGTYNQYSRLYALGIDSYYLATSMNKLLSTNNGIAGATGILYIDQYKHIYRRLDWAEMRDGTPYLLTGDST